MIAPAAVTALPSDAVALVTAACLVLSAFFSGAETGLMSVSRLKLRDELHGARATAARRLEDMLGRVEDPILACLIGTNVFNVLASSLVAAAFTTRWGPRGDLAAAALMSVLVIVFGEILPKMLYRTYPMPLTLRSVGPLRTFMVLVTPVRAALLGYATLLDRVLPGRPRRDGGGPGREGMATLLRDHAGGDGLLFDELLSRCLSLTDLNLGSLATHMGRIVSLPRDASLAECRHAAAVSGFSRLPVHDGDPTRPMGWILVRDLLFVSEDDEWTGVPDELLRTCPLVDQSMSPWALFEEMRWQRQQMAIVTDAAGTPTGLVTLEDLLEMLVGSIEDEFDRGWRRAGPVNHGG